MPLQILCDWVAFVFASGIFFMAENKSGFVLYADLIHTVSKLPDDKAGQLFKHILMYVNDQNPVTNDIIIEISFEPIKQQLKRDLVKWEKEVLKKSESGILGNLKRYEPDLYEKVIDNQLSIHDASVIAKGRKVSHPDSLPSHPIAKLADNDTVNVKDTVKEIQSFVGTTDQYAKVEKSIKGITDFIKTNKPRFINPYTDLWNLFSEKYGTAKVKAETETRKKKIKIRTGEPNFDFAEILRKATEQKFALESAWFNFDFLIENDTNYMKVLEGKYIQKQVEQPQKPTQSISRPNYE